MMPSRSDGVRVPLNMRVVHAVGRGKAVRELLRQGGEHLLRDLPHVRTISRRPPDCLLCVYGSRDPGSLTPFLRACSPPARYTLTNQSLKITNVEVFRCCGWRWCRCACCGIDQNVNNVDLNYIRDVDFVRNSGCCLDEAFIRVENDTGSEHGLTTMKVDGADAAEVVTLIKNAVEDAKMRREKARPVGNV